MKIKKLDSALSVIQIENVNAIDLSIRPLFLGLTKDELSVVLPTSQVPEITRKREDDWRAFKIEGVLDFSLVGILAEIASLLAKKDISIFALSTYNTDYILVKKDRFEEATDLLSENNYELI